MLAGQQLPPYITFYPALVIAALAGGPRIGVITAIATLLLAWFFFIPRYGSFITEGAAAPLTLLIYSLTSTFLGWTVGHARLALEAAITAEARRDRAARESVHRIRNLLAVVQALLSKVAKEVSTTEEYRHVLASRIAALDVAQSVLVRSDWKDADLGQMIDAALAPFLPNPGLHVTRGPYARAPSRHVGGLCMALYELCTNSMKYGALAEGRGPVSLSWSSTGGETTLEWNERAPVAAGHGESFGTQLIRNALAREASTDVDYVVAGDSVRAVFKWRDDSG